jgi:hypothetical protein
MLLAVASSPLWPWPLSLHVLTCRCGHSRSDGPATGSSRLPLLWGLWVAVHVEGRGSAVVGLVMKGGVPGMVPGSYLACIGCWR